MNRDILTLIDNISSWLNFLTSKHKTKLRRTLKQTQPIQMSLSEFYHIKKVISEDSSHPLHPRFKVLPSGRWYTTPVAQEEIFHCLCKKCFKYFKTHLFCVFCFSIIHVFMVYLKQFWLSEIWTVLFCSAILTETCLFFFIKIENKVLNLNLGKIK